MKKPAPKRLVVGTVAILATILLILSMGFWPQKPASIEARTGAEARVMTPQPSPTKGDGSGIGCQKLQLEKDAFAAGDPAFIALSGAELQWLKRRGFPAKEQIENLSPVRASELEDKLRNHKDMMAGVYLGHIRRDSGDLSGALSAFTAAANLGSLYAYEQAAQIEFQRSTRSEASTMYFLAKLLAAQEMGDHRATGYFSSKAAKIDFKKWEESLQENAEVLLRQDSDAAISAKLSPRDYSVRPNKVLWQEALRTRQVIDACLP